MKLALRAVISVFFIALILMPLAGCRRPDTQLSYVVPRGALDLTLAAERPTAYVGGFEDLREGSRGCLGRIVIARLIPGFPFIPLSDPTFCFESGRNRACYSTLADQYRQLVSRHLSSKGIFKVVNKRDLRKMTGRPLFEMTASINKTKARGYYSLFGLSLAGVILGDLISFASVSYEVDINLKCTDALGGTVVEHTISGRSRAKVGNYPWLKNCLAQPGFGRFDLLRQMLSDGIGEFVKKLHEELEQKDSLYWDDLVQEAQKPGKK